GGVRRRCRLAGERGGAHSALVRPRTVGGAAAGKERGGDGGGRMTIGELSQRLRRADFLDGLGIYVGPHEVALAHVAKRFFRVALRHAATFPLPGAGRPGERRQALAQAVTTSAREHRVDTRRTYLCVSPGEAACNRVILPAAACENLGHVLHYALGRPVPPPRSQASFAF